MAKLRFRFATMESGKSAEILQVNYNYNSRNIYGVLLIPDVDEVSNGNISSRLGISAPAYKVSKDTNLYELVTKLIKDRNVSYVIVDEANFLTEAQAEQLGDIVDFLDIDVLAYGLLTNFKTRQFEGSQRLIDIADEREHIYVRSICHCGKKANFNARVVDGKIVTDGEEVILDKKDGEEHEVKYIPLCRKCFKLNKIK